MTRLLPWSEDDLPVLEACNTPEQNLHAFPSPDNIASNAICRKAGFTLLSEVEFEFPPGHIMLSNDWRFDLTG